MYHSKIDVMVHGNIIFAVAKNGLLCYNKGVFIKRSVWNGAKGLCRCKNRGRIRLSA